MTLLHYLGPLLIRRIEPKMGPNGLSSRYDPSEYMAAHNSGGGRKPVAAGKKAPGVTFTLRFFPGGRSGRGGRNPRVRPGLARVELFELPC